jgi:hypothetical protein
MNRGHGHVVPRPDGVRARCGGPATCRVCQAEQAALKLSAPLPAGVPSIARYPRLEQLREQIREVIATHQGAVPLAGVLGILRIIEHELIQEHVD